MKIILVKIKIKKILDCTRSNIKKVKTIQENKEGELDLFLKNILFFN
ncbi:unnamed protein product [Musa acuminata subsp. burmannicoides]